MLVRLICFLRGSVKLLISGPFVERFINLCLHRGFFLWNIRKCGNAQAQLCMSLRAFKAIRPIARKTHTRIRILEKHGLPVRMSKGRRRIGFLIGLLVATVSLYAASLLLWSVEIAPTVHVSESEIRSVLAELGVRPGAIKSRIVPREIKDRALLKLDELSWLWVEIHGARAYVQVLEKRPAPEIVSSEACDIVSTRDGIITEIIATEGQTKVKVGDTVLRGQLLISAVFTSEREGIAPRLTHASGQVYARTWYEASTTVSAMKTVKQFTERTHTHRRLKLGNFSLPLGSQKALPFEKCDVKKVSHDLVIFGKYIGLSYQTDTYMEYETEQRMRTEADLVSEYEKALDAQIETLLYDKTAVRTNAHTTVISNADATFTITRTAEYQEQIGSAVPLP